MAVRTTALLPFPVTSIPDRLSAVYITKKSPTTFVNSTTTTAPVYRLNRLQTAEFGMSTNVTEISEMGSQSRVGGVDDLGEAKFKLEYESVGISNISALCGADISATAGTVNTIGLTQLQNAQIDFFRFVADPQSNIFATLYMQDCIIDDYTIDVKSTGTIMESIQGRGPNATYFAGYFVPKNYTVLSADVSNGYIPLSSIMGADEAPVQVYSPSAVYPFVPTSYWNQNGTQYFFKISVTNPAGTATQRYFENSTSDTTHVATYNASTGHLSLSNGGSPALVAGQTVQVVYMSYACDCFPNSIPFSAPDTAARPAVAARLAPILIGVNQFQRVQTASVKFALKRDHVNGVGENSIIYGVSSIPDVTVSFDVKETDSRMLDMLQNNQVINTNTGGAIQNDFFDLNYITRSGLNPNTPIPFKIEVLDPLNSGATLVTYATPQLVVKDIDFNSSSKADNTVKISAIDIQGVLTAAFTTFTGDENIEG